MEHKVLGAVILVLVGSMLMACGRFLRKSKETSRESARRVSKGNQFLASVKMMRKEKKGNTGTSL